MAGALHPGFAASNDFHVDYVRTVGGHIQTVIAEGRFLAAFVKSRQVSAKNARTWGTQESIS